MLYLLSFLKSCLQCRLRAGGQPVPYDQSPGHRLSTKTGSTWIWLVCFYHLHHFRGALSHAIFFSIQMYICFCLAGCQLWWLEHFVSYLSPGSHGCNSTCVPASILNCCVGLRNPSIKAYTQLLIHLRGVCIFGDLLQLSGRKKPKFRDVNMLVTEGVQEGMQEAFVAVDVIFPKHSSRSQCYEQFSS